MTYAALDSILSKCRRHVPNFGILLDDVAKVSPEKLVDRPLTPEAKLILLSLVLGRTPKRFFAEIKRYLKPLKETWAGTEKTVVIEGNPLRGYYRGKIAALKHSLGV